MIWHIVHKDWKLLRRMVLAVALMNVFQRAVVSSFGPFWDPRSSLSAVTSLLGTITLLADALLIVMVVQQDAVPGMRQDWLVRPIRRRDLLLSKLVFVAVFVQGPIFVVEVLQGIAAGFPLRAALGAPLSRSLWMLAAMDLPVLAFATLTSNLTHAAGGALGVVLCYAFFTVSTQLSGNGAASVRWVHDAIRVLWAVVAAGVILAVQYRWRRITGARWAFGAAAVVWLAIGFLPAHAAFVIEERLAGDPAAASAIQVQFAPDAGRFHPPGGARPIRIRPTGPTEETALWIPFRFPGLRADGILSGEVRERLIPPRGMAVDLGPVFLFGDATKPHHQLTWIPPAVYERWKDEPVSLEVQLDLTLLRFGAPREMPRSDSKQWIDQKELCATRLAGGIQLEIGCMAPGNGALMVLTLGDPGRRMISGNRADYAPYFGRVAGDSISRIRPEVPPLVAQAPGTSVSLWALRPQAQFDRRIMISNIKLSDWRAE